MGPIRGVLLDFSVYESCTKAYSADMSVPVTSRLDESVVEALDQAVASGLAPSRGSLVAEAVSQWLRQHGEESIVASYKRRYVPDETVAQQDQALIGSLAAFSVAACLADDRR